VAAADKELEVRFGVLENIDFSGKMRDKEHAVAVGSGEVWNMDTLRGWSEETY